MIDLVQPYPTYRNSGVWWLGRVPKDWDVRRIKTLFRERDERSGDGAGVLLSLTRSQGLVPQADASTRMASAEDLSRYKVCRPGDLVMNRMQAWSGMFAVSPIQGLVSPDYAVFEATGASDVRYFEHLFKTPLLVDEFARRSKGIGSGFNRLYTPDFGAVAVAVPSGREQAAIVRFLQHADRRIRQYVGARQKLVGRAGAQTSGIIGEYRARLITAVVIGELDVRKTIAGLPDEVEEPYPQDEETDEGTIASEESPNLDGAVGAAER